MILILAEKPDLMKKVADAISNPKSIKKNKGYYVDQPKQIIYTHAVGHLLALVKPEVLNPNLKKWSSSDYPFFYRNVSLEVIPNVKEQFSIVKKLFEDNRITEVVNCCDADREGELIFRNILVSTKCKCKKRTRMWISSTTPSGILEAFNERVPLSEYDNLAEAAKLRSLADYHIGLNSTVLLTNALKPAFPEVYSAGRVQTPTLNMIVERELEILNFHEKTSYKYKLEFDTGKETYCGVANDTFESVDELKKFYSSLDLKKEFTVSDSKLSTKKTKPSLLFSLSDLQIYLSSKNGFSAKKTLDIVQSLYEKYSLVTYPRTDSQKISPQMVEKIPSILGNLSIKKPIVSEILKSKYSISKDVIATDGKIGSHEALTPTDNGRLDLSKLTKDEMTVYTTIVDRFLENFFPELITEKQSFVTFQNDHDFLTDMTKVLSRGWTVVSDPSRDLGSHVDVQDNDKVRCVKDDVVEEKTRAPSRFTEGTLIKAMKNPSKYTTDKDEVKTLKKIQGIGTEATRSAIIEGLKHRKYIENDKNKIIPTKKGMDFIKIIPCEELKSVSLTVRFENELEEIANGNHSSENFYLGIEKLDKIIARKVNSVSVNTQQQYNTCSNFDNVGKLFHCSPKCDGKIVETSDKYYCSKCNNVIWKNALAKSMNVKKITSKQAKELFKNGITTKKVKMTSSKSGKSFEAFITFYGTKVWIGF